MSFYLRPQSSCEFVSSAHPDRLCDNLAAIVINDIQKKDGAKSHAAIEVFATHDSVIFAGEATTSLILDDKYLESVVKRGYDLSGYIPEMRQFWTKEEVVLPEDLEIVNKICPQSPDIALGTTDLGEDSGYNDQGIFFSSADNTTENHTGYSMFLATRIGEKLQQVSRQSILHPESFPCVLGPDNKVVVTTKLREDGITPTTISAITIAVAHASKDDIEQVREYVKSIAVQEATKMGAIITTETQWVINGTGRFVIHGQVSDTSMTGRKISVNHPSAGPIYASKNIGGGSLVKCLHASDLILNIASRVVANVLVQAKLTSYAIVGTAGAIGQTQLQSLFIHGDKEFEDNQSLKKYVIQFFSEQIDWAPVALARKFGMLSPTFDFAKAVDKNFFGDPSSQPWEHPDFIQSAAQELIDFCKNKGVL